MKEISLKTGKLIVKGDYVIVEETKTENSDYAAYIFENLGTTPKYIVFSDTSFKGVSQNTVNMYFSKLAELYPEVKEAMDKSIPFEYDEDGRIANREESLAEPHLFMANIWDKKPGEHLDYGLGIIRQEVND